MTACAPAVQGWCSKVLILVKRGWLVPSEALCAFSVLVNGLTGVKPHYYSCHSYRAGGRRGCRGAPSNEALPYPPGKCTSIARSWIPAGIAWVLRVLCVLCVLRVLRVLRVWCVCVLCVLWTSVLGVTEGPRFSWTARNQQPGRFSWKSFIHHKFGRMPPGL